MITSSENGEANLILGFDMRYIGWGGGRHQKHTRVMGRGGGKETCRGSSKGLSILENNMHIALDIKKKSLGLRKWKKAKVTGGIRKQKDHFSHDAEEGRGWSYSTV